MEEKEWKKLNIENTESDEALHILVVLSHAYKTLMEYAKKDVKQYGLNLTEFAVLELLYHKGAQPIQKIGQRILMASSSLTYVIDQLEKKKYLTRDADLKDRRVSHASLTPEGMDLMKTYFPQHKQSINQAMNALDIEEKQMLAMLLKKLGKGINDN